MWGGLADTIHLSAPQIAKKIADPEEDAKVSDDSDKTLEVPADTPLAYNYCELLIHGDGSLELMVEKGTK